jgi:hypothetical protein
MVHSNTCTDARKSQRKEQFMSDSNTGTNQTPDQPATGAGAPDGVERRRNRAPRRAWTGREALVRQLRRPVIGLTLAGAAAPLVVATQQTPDLDNVFGGAETEGDPTILGMAPGQDLEESIAGLIGEDSADAEREREITSAMERHGIARDLAEDIFDAAAENNIEPKVAYGLVRTESTFKEGAVSPVGARGLTQVMPRTAAWLVPGTKATDLHDRKTNLELGFRYLDQMIDKYKGNVHLALLAYNRGPGTVDKVLRQGGDPDNGYAAKVLRG